MIAQLFIAAFFIVISVVLAKFMLKIKCHNRIIISNFLLIIGCFFLWMALYGFARDTILVGDANWIFLRVISPMLICVVLYLFIERGFIRSFLKTKEREKVSGRNNRKL